METGKIGIVTLLFFFISFSFQFAFGTNHCEYWQESKGEYCVLLWWASQDLWLAVGVGTAAVAVAIAAIVTVSDRRRDIKKRTQELIQLYDEELREISEQEKNLTTKLDCNLYVERYLDTLEKIATLSNDKNFGKSVSDFFDNNFSYGIDLWRWYQKNVVRLSIDIIGIGKSSGPLWCLPHREPPKRHILRIRKPKKKLPQLTSEDLNDFKERYHKTRHEAIDYEFEKYLEAHPSARREEMVENYLKNKLLPELNDKELTISLNKFLEEERWSEFRAWCLLNEKHPITALQNDFGIIHQPIIPKEEKYRILPDSLYDSFDLLPEEDGLSKGEFIQIIQSFSKDLDKLAENEGNLKTKTDCSIYAERYLDTLEEISSLYKQDIIPKKAADYFENKFSLGINLWNWYEKFVDTKQSQDEKSKEIKKTQEEIMASWNRSDEISQDDRWRDFRWWCKGGKDGQNVITEFPEVTIVDEEGIEVGSILPATMYYYDELPENDGIGAAQLLNIITSFGKQLTDLTDKERHLKTKLDCTVYAEQYLDTLEQIAYLFNSKALATDIPTYFENNFSYGLTILIWYVNKLGEDIAQADTRWSDFKKYTDEWEKAKEDDEEKRKFIPLEPFPENKLPDTMIKYFDQLPEDLVEEANRKERESSKDVEKE